MRANVNVNRAQVRLIADDLSTAADDDHADGRHHHYVVRSLRRSRTRGAAVSGRDRRFNGRSRAIRVLLCVR